MATKLKKPIKRELSRLQATKKGRIELPDKLGFIPVGCRNVIITLLPSEEIEFRVKGTQQKFIVHMMSVMALAQGVTFYNQWAERMRIYKLKKDAGHKRIRKPNKPSHPSVASMLRKLYSVVH